MKFLNKTVLVTGVTSGIGQATAKRFYDEGANLILLGRSQSKLDAVCKELAGKEGKIRQIVCDVTNEKDVEAFFKTCGPIDVAVNNAGIEGKMEVLEELTLADLDQVFAVNVRALFHFLKLEIENMKANKTQGVIVNVSSSIADKGFPTRTLYTATKSAVNAMTRCLAVEEGPNGIRIVGVSPGPVDTPMLRRILGDDLKFVEDANPLRKVGKPMEIANAIVWLASEEASFMTGSPIPVDGGELAK
jgi:NAD(P)-dependent dehydrogenase (short-subunit alcohol dehydrogenase family)